MINIIGHGGNKISSDRLLYLALQKLSIQRGITPRLLWLLERMPGGPGDFCEACLMLERLCLCQTTWLCSALATLHTGQSEPNMHLGNKKDATGWQFFIVGESTFKIYEKLLFWWRMGNQIWGQNIYVITASMKIIWNSAILTEQCWKVKFNHPFNNDSSKKIDF